MKKGSILSIERMILWKHVLFFNEILVTRYYDKRRKAARMMEEKNTRMNLVVYQ